MSALSQAEHQRNLSAGLTVTWVCLVVNALFVAIQWVVGFTVGSRALIADGVHTLSDLFGGIVILLGLRWGWRQADENHPFGHARIETMAGMFTGVVLLIVGAMIASNAIMALYHHRESHPSLAAVIVAAATVLVKEGMYWYTMAVGRRIRSLALVASAWHHRSDALSSVAVLVGVGAGFIDPDWHIADAIAALAVTYFIIRVGAQLTWSAGKQMVDTAPGREVLQSLRTLAQGVEGVRQVHDITARYSGNNILVEIHIVVDPDLSVRQGHDIAEVVRLGLTNEIPDVTRVLVHVDPEPD